MSRGCNIPSIRYLSIEDCKKLQAQAFQQYNAYTSESDIHRNNFQDNMITTAEAEGNFEKAKKIRRQQLSEGLRRTNRTIRT